MRERNALRNGTTPQAEDIAREAYAIYERRGWHNGRDLDDWLEAERRLNGFLQSDAEMNSDTEVRSASGNENPPSASRKRGDAPVPEPKPKAKRTESGSMHS